MSGFKTNHSFYTVDRNIPLNSETAHIHTISLCSNGYDGVTYISISRPFFWRCSELPLWEQNGSKQWPEEQSCSCPPSHNPDPNRRPTNIDQFPTLTNWSGPPSKKHSWIHTGQGENEMEEGIWIWYWLGLLFFFLLFILVVQWKQRLPWTFIQETRIIIFQEKMSVIVAKWT